jgi:hypothetical protein
MAAKFNWEDPFHLDAQLSDDERAWAKTVDPDGKVGGQEAIHGFVLERA